MSRFPLNKILINIAFLLLSPTIIIPFNKMVYARDNLENHLSRTQIKQQDQQLIAIAHDSTEVRNTNDVALQKRVICLSTSGNGYNWAATFTWAAEIIRDAVVHSPPDVRFNVACVSGSSSGSAFVASYGSLLNNKKLFSRSDFNPQNITKKEAQILSKALLYMALAADFRSDVAKFYTSPDGNSQPATLVEINI